MSEQSTTIHATAEQIAAVSKAHGDSDAMLSARVKAVRNAARADVKMSTLADDLKAASAVDPTINAVSSTILGFALAASDVVDMTGVKFGAVKSDALATLYRGAKRVGTKAFRQGVREALKPLSDDVSADERLAIVVTVAETAAATRREYTPKTREANGQGGTSGAIADAAADAGLTVPADPSADPLKGIRAAVRYLQQGGELTADMRSAIAELTAAASAASKRSRPVLAAV